MCGADEEMKTLLKKKKKQAWITCAYQSTQKTYSKCGTLALNKDIRDAKVTVCFGPSRKLSPLRTHTKKFMLFPNMVAGSSNLTFGDRGRKMWVPDHHFCKTRTRSAWNP